MRIVFMGTPAYATVILKALIENGEIEVAALITQPDKPVGRKQVITPPDTKKFLLDTSLDIPIFQPKTLRDKASVNYVKELNPDFIIVAAFGQILPIEILNIAPCINLHASILPKYRGASPIQDSILHLDEFTGVTAMLMNEGLDTGDILGYTYVKIEDMNVIELFEKLSYAAAVLTLKTVKIFNAIKPIKQKNCDTSYSKKIVKNDGLVEFKDAQKVYAKYRGYIFWPGIFLENGLKLKEIILNEYESINDKGKILVIEDDNIIVGCEKGTLRVSKVQPQSKKEMGVIDYLRGKRLEVGDHLS